MSVSIPDLWKLLIESQLLTREQCQHLASSFGNAQGATTDSNALAQWLISQNVVSRYQAQILLAGRPGPFCYGDYKVYDRIESGRLQGWFRAVHTATNHPVMLRFLTGAASQDAALWAEVVNSIAVTNHPNLVRFYQAVDLGSYKFLVAEDLRGEALAERLQTSGSLPADEACRVAQLTANGLSHLHQLGRPHGDPRPVNFWLESNGNVKVFFEPDASPAAPNFVQAGSNGELLAKAEYFAPEFLQAGKTPDHLTDIYALGCSLYELIAARPPFAGGTLQEKMQRHSAEAIQPLESVGAPQPVGQAVAYMMAKNPAVRYQAATAVAEQLAQFVGAAQANYQPTARPATLQAYETALQQRPAAVATPVAQPVVVAQGAGSGINVAAAPAAPSSGVNIAASPAAGSGINVAKAPSVKKGGARSSAAVTTARRARTKSRQRNNLIMFGSAIGVAAVLLLIGVIVLSSMGGGSQPPDDGEEVAVVPTEQPVEPVEPTPEQNGDNGGAEVAEESGEGELIVEDDGQHLWASTTQGEPIELKYVPNGARVLMIVRPAEMISQTHGEQVLKALGPDFESARSQWEAASGFPLGDIQQLTIACYPNEGQFPKVCSVVQLAAEANTDSLLAKWGNPAEVEGLPATYQKGNTAYYIPGDGGNRFFVMGPLETEIRDLVAGNQLPPHRDLGRLLRSSDDQRHVTIVFLRDFFYGDGKQLFAGPRAKALDSLEWFFGDGLKAGMVGLHFDDPFYFEFRAQNDVTVDPQTLADNLRARVDAIPESIESHLYKLNPPQYWKPMVLNFKPMVGELHAYTRSGIDLDQATINSVLPGVAAHNLAFGGEMLLALAPGGMVAVAPTASKPTPKTIEALLNAKFSYGFPSNDMVIAMQELEEMVSDEHRSLPFEFRVKIMGGDLELDGITKNQRINDFNRENESLAQILTAMVLAADSKGADPAVEKQRLLWVTAPDPDNPSNKIVLITTRKVATEKYTIPEIFRPK
jgi:hypothetical protein